MGEHKAPKTEKKMFPLVMISQEFRFLFTPPQSENVYKLKRNDQYRKAPGPVSRLEAQGTIAEKTQKRNHLYHQP